MLFLLIVAESKVNIRFPTAMPYALQPTCFNSKSAGVKCKCSYQKAKFQLFCLVHGFEILDFTQKTVQL